MRPEKHNAPRCGALVVPRQDQLLRADSARSVISSTLPVPWMARYLGAAAGSALAQLE